MTPLQAAQNIIINKQYVKNWFDASNFFNTVYTSDVYKGDHFITCDHFMSSKIWTLHHITPEGIQTITNGNTKDHCINAMKEHRR